MERMLEHSKCYRMKPLKGPYCSEIDWDPILHMQLKYLYLVV